MTILTTFVKQPNEVQDYDIEFGEWLAALNDTPKEFTVISDAGITQFAASLIGTTVKVWLSDGIDGESYEITVRLKTNGGRTKEAEIRIKVKEL